MPPRQPPGPLTLNECSTGLPEKCECETFKPSLSSGSGVVFKWRAADRDVPESSSQVQRWCLRQAGITHSFDTGFAGATWAPGLLRISASRRLCRTPSEQSWGQGKDEDAPINGAVHGPSLVKEEAYDEHTIGANLVCRRPDFRRARERRNGPTRPKTR